MENVGARLNKYSIIVYTICVLLVGQYQGIFSKHLLLKGTHMIHLILGAGGFGIIWFLERMQGPLPVKCGKYIVCIVVYLEDEGMYTDTPTPQKKYALGKLCRPFEKSRVFIRGNIDKIAS